MGRRQSSGGGSLLVLFALIAVSVVSCVNWLGNLVSPEIDERPAIAQTQPQQQIPQVQKPAQPVPQKPEPLRLQKAQPGYVKGNKVALRSSPSKDSAILDRLNTGYRIERLTVEGDWTQIRDPLTQKTGWIASYLLTDKKLKQIEEKSPEPEKPKVKPAGPQISDAAIIKAIIAASISNYSGSCPCPYNRDRGGRSCGKRSAYSKPGGASPICFAGDVTPQMLNAWRDRLN